MSMHLYGYVGPVVICDDKNGLLENVIDNQEFFSPEFNKQPKNKLILLPNLGHSALKFEVEDEEKDEFVELSSLREEREKFIVDYRDKLDKLVTLGVNPHVTYMACQYYM